VVEDARSAYCAPNKRAAWDKFLARVLGAAAAKRLLRPPGAAAAAAAPVAASPPQSPPASPRRRGRPSNASKAAVTTPATPPYAPTALDYAALASAGVGVGVVAAAAAPGGCDALARGFQRAIQSLAAATGADDAAVRWVLKVVTVGGTLALSGAVVGGIILALASVIVYAVFAGAGRGGGRAAVSLLSLARATLELESPFGGKGRTIFWTRSRSGKARDRAKHVRDTQRRTSFFYGRMHTFTTLARMWSPTHRRASRRAGFSSSAAANRRRRVLCFGNDKKFIFTVERRQNPRVL
jgi:hypothetical protein